MPSLAISGFGTLMKMEDPGTPGTFLTIAEVKDITGPGLSASTLDTTSHSSSGPWREFIASLIDGGEVTFDINYVPTSATHNASTGLLSRMASRALTNFKLVFPNAGATTWSFAGLVTNFTPGAPVDDFLSASVTIKVSGQPTLA